MYKLVGRWANTAVKHQHSLYTQLYSRVDTLSFGASEPELVRAPRTEACRPFVGAPMDAAALAHRGAY